MSDQDTTAITPDANVPVAKPAPKRKAKKASSSFSVNDLAIARLRKRGVANVKEHANAEEKVVRGILRANFEFVAKNDASVRKAKSRANDGNRWPSAMNAHTFAVAVEGKRPPKK